MGEEWTEIRDGEGREVLGVSRQGLMGNDRDSLSQIGASFLYLAILLDFVNENSRV
jgi:hypothetical protein